MSEVLSRTLFSGASPGILYSERRASVKSLSSSRVLSVLVVERYVDTVVERTTAQHYLIILQLNGMRRCQDSYRDRLVGMVRDNHSLTTLRAMA